jgi:prepilin-type N-terminal cleavage/methylation domain-containing protein
MKNDRGFTLIELMTAILVLGILLGFAIPNFREMTRNNRIAAAQNSLLTALNLARNEALHRNVTVSICASTDGSTCASDVTDWKNGWLVFTDTAGTVGSVDSDDEILQRWGPVEGDTTLAGSASFLAYAPTGMQTPLGTTKTFKVSAPSCIGENARLLSIGSIGSVTATQTTCP